ncbi:uncharacterized protein LOC134234788 [Saccostrea cucullata]|uniref:uncharacterized protein LOC134234788 n=1 Tax=Saccostrea cuccullata TaxID=36930 RepID=UPI002ED3B03F
MIADIPITIESIIPAQDRTFNPEIIGTVSTGYNETCRVKCIPNKNQFYVMGDKPIIKQMNTDEKLLDKIPTMSGTDLYDLAVTKEGYLVYIDKLSKYINIIMKRGEIGCLISLQEWTPLALCSSSIEGLLVAMKSSNSGQSKVVRYVDSTATQDIQNNSEGKALYSNPFCIEENKNFDIIVSDYDVGKVVIVDKNGKFRFSYMMETSSQRGMQDLHHVL